MTEPKGYALIPSDKKDFAIYQVKWALEIYSIKGIYTKNQKGNRHLNVNF